MFSSSALLSLRMEPEDCWDGFWRSLQEGDRSSARRYLHADAGGDTHLLMQEETPEHILHELTRHWEPRILDRSEDVGVVHLNISIEHRSASPCLARGLEAAVDSLAAEVPRDSLQSAQMRVSLVRENGIWRIRDIALPEAVVQQFRLLRGEEMKERELATNLSSSPFNEHSLLAGYRADGTGYLRVTSAEGELVELLQLPSFDALSARTEPSVGPLRGRDVRTGPEHWDFRDVDGDYLLGGTGPDGREYLFYLDERGQLDEQVVLNNALFTHLDGEHMCADDRFVLTWTDEAGEGEEGGEIYDLQEREFLSLQIPGESPLLYKRESGALWMDMGDSLRPAVDREEVLLAAAYEYVDLESRERLSIDPGPSRLVAHPESEAMTFCPGEGRMAFISTPALDLRGAGHADEADEGDEIISLGGQERILPGGEMSAVAGQKYLSIYCFYEDEIIVDAPIPLSFPRLSDVPDVTWLNSRYLHLEDDVAGDIYFDLAGPVFRHYLPNDRSERLRDKFFTEGVGDEERKIALTFDDGPDAVHTPEVLSILREYDVPATFFVLGNHVKKWPEITRRIVEEGHALGNHSLDHSRMAPMSAEGMYRWQIEPTQEIISDAVGFQPALFRPPYGDILDWQVRYLAERGIQTVNWSVDPADWDPETGGAEEIARRAVHYSYEGAIILLHASDAKESVYTIEALPEIIEELRERGYSFVTVPELLDIEAERGTQE